jgi:hypothetical protein
MRFPSLCDAERHAQAKLQTTYEKRREVVKAISKFWPVALMNHPMIAIHAQHNTDQAALSYLEDLWMIRDSVETRAFTLEFVGVFPYVCSAEESSCAYFAGRVALQGKPVLQRQGVDQGVQIRAPAQRRGREAGRGRHHAVHA